MHAQKSYQNIYQKSSSEKMKIYATVQRCFVVDIVKISD